MRWWHTRHEAAALKSGCSVERTLHVEDHAAAAGVGGSMAAAGGAAGHGHGGTHGKAVLHHHGAKVKDAESQELMPLISKLV